MSSSSTFTAEELEKIRELRKRVRTEFQREDQVSDHYLIKWLRARSLDVEKAEEMLRKSLEWRRENKVDTILETMDIPERFQKNVPFAYLGTDPTSGCPILLYCMGRYDMRKDVEELGIDTLLRYNIFFMEYMHKVIFKECSEKAGKPITSFMELVDLDRYNYRQLANSECREMIMKMQIMFDSNYPEVISHMAIINAPKIFYFLYNMMKPFAAKATLDKISIYDPNNWQDDVKQRFPMELIPPHWGGTRAGRDEFCSGDPIWIFGLDKNYFKDLEVVKVMPRDKVHLEFDVFEKGSSITWKFKSEGHDICFGIFHEETEILPIKRVESHKEIQMGELECDKIGKYRVVFDNSYSYTKWKCIHHRIEIISPFSNIDITPQNFYKT